MRTLRERITVSSVGIVGVLAVLLALLAYNVVKGAIQSEVDGTLREQAQQTARLIDRPLRDVFDLDRSQGSPDRRDLPKRLMRRELLAQVVDSDGNVVLSTMSGSRVSDLPEVGVNVGSDAWKARTVRLDNGVSYRLYELSSSNYVIRTARETTEFENFLDRLATILASGTLLAVASALLLSRWIASASLHPIARMTTTARRIQSTGDLSQRVETAFEDAEFAELSASLNDMLDSLEVSREAQRNFAADASHELKTPLTSLRGNARFVAASEHADPEVAQAASAIVRDIERVVDLADSLTTLAWLDAEPPPQLEEIQLDAFFADELARARSLHPDHSFELIDEREKGSATSDPALLRRIVGNLLDNAGKYTPHGTHVVLHSQPTSTGAIHLLVSDDGPGMPTDEHARAFDRFQRGAGAAGTKGTGLGLAIVRAAAERLGGTAQISTGHEASGLAIEIVLPPANLSPNSHQQAR